MLYAEFIIMLSDFVFGGFFSCALKIFRVCTYVFFSFVYFFISLCNRTPGKGKKINTNSCDELILMCILCCCPSISFPIIFYIRSVFPFPFKVFYFLFIFVLYARFFHFLGSLPYTIHSDRLSISTLGNVFFFQTINLTVFSLFFIHIILQTTNMYVNQCHNDAHEIFFTFHHQQ